MLTSSLSLKRSLRQRPVTYTRTTWASDTSKYSLARILKSLLSSPAAHWTKRKSRQWETCLTTLRVHTLWLQGSWAMLTQVTWMDTRWIRRWSPPHLEVHLLCSYINRHLTTTASCLPMESGVARSITTLITRQEPWELEWRLISRLPMRWYQSSIMDIRSVVASINGPFILEGRFILGKFALGCISWDSNYTWIRRSRGWQINQCVTYSTTQSRNITCTCQATSAHVRHIHESVTQFWATQYVSHAWRSRSRGDNHAMDAIFRRQSNNITFT